MEVETLKSWEKMEDILFRSLEEKKPLDIIYESKEHLFTQRRILIRTIYSTHIEAYCFLRNQYRCFNIENILSAIPVKPSRPYNEMY